MELRPVMSKVGVEDTGRANDRSISQGNLYDRDNSTQNPEIGQKWAQIKSQHQL